MNRERVKALYNITSIKNVPSILRDGILSHNRVGTLPHQSIAMVEIQQIRKNKEIPGAGFLHDYANLYFDAHNPMLSKKCSENNSICILCVNPCVLDVPGVIIADMNAASKYVRFFSVTEGLRALDEETVFSKSWIHDEDIIAEWQHKAKKCAEVLVPHYVKPEYIFEAYVANSVAEQSLAQICSLKLSVKSGIFFGEP